MTWKLFEQNVCEGGHDGLFVLPDSEIFQKPKMDVDELVDAREDPLHDVLA